MKQFSFLLAGIFAFMCYTGWSQTLPAGFSTTTIGSGWVMPLGTAFTSDGQKMFVWEKDGRVYVCNRNASGAYIKQTTPVLDISEEVANWGDHGLMGFALDPNYLSNGLIYCLYVVDRYYLMNFGTPGYNPASSSTGATIGRITRYKTTTSGSNTVADLSSRFILLGETRQTGICIMHDSHGLGTLAFASDGTLLATAGDGGSYYLVDKGSDTDTDFETALADGIIRPAENVGAFRAQMLNCHNGKLLRIDPVTGNGVSSNPYYSAAQPRSPKSRVWAFGLRNPYRFSIKPGTGSTNPAAGDVGEIFVGDVGWNTYEEVSIITKGGVNCGWPLFEGLTAQPGYTSAVTANLDEPNPLYGIGGCTKQYFNFQDLIKQVTADNNKTVYNSCNPATAIGTGDRYVHYRPAIEWKHFTNEARVGTFTGNTASVAIIGTPESNVIGTPFPGNCATGGPWYNGTNFPATYQNKYFVADHDGQWIRCFSVDFTDVVTEVKNFGTGFLGTVNVNVNPLDGTMVVVELGNFSTIGPAIKQIQYGGNQAPVVKMTSDKTFGPSVLPVNFTGNTSSDPDGTITSYAWNFGDGATSTSANPSHNFTAAANTPTKYVVKLTVTDNLGASSLDSIIISVNNTPPVVNITSPVKNSLYKIGPDTVYTCSATVTDAEHNAAGLKYEWQTILRHNSHAHPEGITTAISPPTTISRIGCNGDTYYWLIRLTVTDAAGLSTVDSSKIFPDCSPGVDNIPPAVSTVSPLNGATNISIGTTVSATFNETIDPVTVTGTTFQLKNASNVIIPAAINTSFNQLTLTPSSVLAGSTAYTATIKGGTPGVKDLAGNALVNDYTWTFTTAVVDAAPPVIIINSVLPANGATGVNPASTVSVNLSEAINASTVNGTSVQLRDAGNNLVAATISTVSDQITLTPSGLLSGLTTYTATIKGGPSGIKDLAGNALVSDFVWSFTTGAVDNIPPTVVSVLPANAAIGVSTGATISANFSEPINPSTVTAATFQLKDAANNIIAASVNASSNQITLTPLSALTGSTTYSVTITGGASGVKDLTGNALTGNYSWSFTTVAVIPPALVNIQSVDTKTGAAANVHSLTGVPAGALLVLSTTADAVMSDCIVSSSPGLTWTKRVDAGATSSDNAEIWTAVYAAGGSITVTSNWGTENSETSVCYVVLNAEPTLGGAFGTAVLQAAPSVTVTTTRENSIIFGCTADWNAINGATRTLRDAASERLYFKDGNYTTYHYTKAATIMGPYTEGVSLPANQQSSTALLEIRGATGASNITPPTVTTQPVSQTKCAGASVSFSSAANGAPVPTAQWQESINGTTWNNIAGAVSGTLSFTTTIADNNKQYRAIWTNSAGPVSSNPATLTVSSMSAPLVTVVNNCGSSVLTAESITGTLSWSNGATSNSITVTSPGTYTVVQTVNGCISDSGNGIAAPNAIPPAPTVVVTNSCGHAVLTASSFTGSLLWSTGETTTSITVTTAATYTVTQMVNGCISAPGSGNVAPIISSVTSPAITVVDNCGSSALTATAFTGTLLWSTGETTPTISVTTAGPYTVTQTIGGCTSADGSATAAPINLVVDPPTISVVDNCTNSVLTGESFTGTLLWSNGSTSQSITVSTPGTYTVTQTVNGCTSPATSGIATPLNSTIAIPAITIDNNCGSTVLTAGSYTGSLLWSNGATTPDISVTSAGTYTVTQTLNGCSSLAGSGIAAPRAIPTAPAVAVVDNCGSSVLTATGFTGTLLWSNSAATASIPVNTAGTYTVTQTINGCTSATGSGVAAPKIIPPAPTVSVVDNCGNSTLTAGSFSGSLLWSNAATATAITVNSAAPYTVTQTLSGCTSIAGSGVAAPKTIPVLSGSLVATAISGTAFSYTPASVTAGTNFAWSRPAVSGVNNTAASGTGNITETLVNTLSTAVNVTYMITLTANGCTNTQNVVVSVSSVPVVTTVSPVNGTTGVSISAPITASFSEAISGVTVTSATFQLKDAGNNIVPATISTSANLITLSPSNALANSTNYTVTIKGGSSGVKGLPGNALVNDYTWSFTTAAVVSQPVTIQSFNTKTGVAATVHTLTGVPAGALLVLASTADAVVSDCIVSSSPALTWIKRVDAGATSSDNAEIWTAVYAAGGSITVTSNWGTNNSQASVCYVVLNAEPSLGGAFGTGVLQTAPSVAITTTKENSIIIGCTADWHAVNGATRTLRDAATERLYFKDGNYTTYHYTKAATSIAGYTEGVSLPTGQQASTALLEIRSGTVIPDNTPPIVSSVTPANGATGIVVSTTVSAVFNEAMDAATINGSTVELRNAANTLIASIVSYNASTRTATLAPSTALANSTVYTITVKGGASGVKDAAGNALLNNYTGSFTTEAGDITPPVVTSVIPSNGTTGVNVGVNIVANFSEPVNASTVNSTVFQLKDPSNNLVPASVSTSAGQIILDPSSPLSVSTVYTATITGGASGVKDLAGNALAANYSWSFTTASVASQPVTIQSFNTKTGMAATVHTLTGVPAGALLVLATTADAVVSNCIVSSTPSLTWTKRVDAGATNSDNAEIWTAVYAAGGSITVTSNWGTNNSQVSVCYIVLNAEPTLAGAFATAVSQSAPSVAITTTRDNSIIFGCTADWNAVNGATRTLRDAATERLYFRDGHYTTYHYTKTATTIAAYTEGVSLPTGQQSSTALLEIRGAGSVATRPAGPAITSTTTNSNSNVYTHSLGQNYPNPFDKGTNISFTLGKAEKVNITLFDVNGRIVKVLINASKDAGKHIVYFNAGSIAKGIYFYKMRAGDFTDVKKLIVW